MKCKACNDEQPNNAQHCGACGSTMGEPKNKELVIKIKLVRDQIGDLECPFCEGTQFDVNIDYIKCYNCEKKIPIKIEVVE